MDSANLEEQSQGLFSELQAALHELASSPLPEDSLASLNQARESLGNLSQITRAYQEETAAALQKSQEERNQFISHVTHELRLPMTSIKGYTDLLRQGLAGPLNEQQLEFLDTIRNNVARMAALLSDLSDLNRIDTGRLKLDLGNLELNEYMGAALESLRTIRERKGQKISQVLPAQLPPVWADPNRLLQIMTCLLRNAIMYTPEGGAITIHASTLNDKVHIQIKDNGIGIGPKDQARLFSPFFRSDDPVVRDQYGWGLSLYLCARLVQIMGGEIGADSIPGSGSAFWFTLPQGGSPTSEVIDG